MKNILVLTSIYPGEGVPNTFTPVVHYFVKEWVKLGYNVIVIHSCNYFPSIYYKCPQWIRKIIISKIGIALPEKKLNKPIHYFLDNVSVYRLPLFKWIPSSNYPEKNLNNQVNIIHKILENNSFIPDIIISHWINPQIYLSEKLKKIYNAKSALILHSNGKEIKKFKNWIFLYQSIDIWGYRSLQIRKEFESIYGIPQHSFRCFSGIPEYYLTTAPQREWNKKINNFIFVGLLIKRKYPDCIIKALHNIYQKQNYHLDIIGNGEMENDLKKLTIKLNSTDNVSFHGRIPRENIINKLDKADVFIMISKNEVFGLVYIEAMARGCIVVASQDEGMEGIIEHGKNGFLCKAGDQNNLEDIIQTINQLSTSEKQQISLNAQKTAINFTDINAAKSYIKNII